MTISLAHCFVLQTQKKPRPPRKSRAKSAKRSKEDEDILKTLVEKVEALEALMESKLLEFPDKPVHKRKATKHNHNNSAASS